MIHKTAIVGSEVSIGDKVEIGPYSVISDMVSIGENVIIGSHVVVNSNVIIGNNCKIYNFSVIGGSPQDLKYSGGKSRVIIGEKTIIREFVTIHGGTDKGICLTRLGENCMIMAYSHIAHDCNIGNNVILSNNTTLAGHVKIGDKVTIGGLVAIHQFVKIGAYAFIGGKSAVVKDVPPFVIVSGNRAKLHGLNYVGMKRNSFKKDVISSLKKIYKVFFRRRLSLSEAFAEVDAKVRVNDEVKLFVNFVRNSSRGITR